MRRLAGVIVASTWLAACSVAGYGPPVDGTRFVSARRNETGMVLYTLQDVAYRPAAGWRAFPDGGIPLYLRDRNLIGYLDSSTGRVAVVHARRNTEWQHGQGQFHIHDFTGSAAVILESGQRRGDYLTDSHYYLLDLRRRTLTPLPLKTDLAARGRDVGYFYLLDTRGTLLFVTPPRGSGTVETATAELWLRQPSGSYALVARGADYYGQSAGELIYWQMEGRKLRAYDVASGRTRELQRSAPAPEARPDVAVRVSSDGKALELGTREADTWRYDKLLAIDRAK